MMFGGSRESPVELQLSDASVLEEATGRGVSEFEKNREINRDVFEGHQLGCLRAREKPKDK